MKRCHKCKAFKELTEYHKDGTRTDGIENKCKKCKAESRNILLFLLSSAKYKAKIKNLEFTLTVEDIEKMKNRQNNKCVLSGKFLNWESEFSEHKGKCPADRVSLDRIDPKKGYTPENTRLLCHFVNRALEQMTDGEFLSWIDDIYNHQRN